VDHRTFYIINRGGKGWGATPIVATIETNASVTLSGGLANRRASRGAGENPAS